MTQKILLLELKRFETYIKEFQRLTNETAEMYKSLETRGELKNLDDEKLHLVLKSAKTIKRMCELDDELIENFLFLKKLILKKLPAEN